jgi:hypothetical protein
MSRSLLSTHLVRQRAKVRRIPGGTSAGSQRSKQLSLAAKSGQALLVLGHVVGKDFDGDESPPCRVLGFVDFAPTADADEG